MNTRIAATSLLLAAAFAGNAFAEGPIQASDPFTSTRTRAEVQAELAGYQRSGVNPWATSYDPLKQFRSARSRDEVVADFIGSRDAVRAFGGEDSGSAYLAQMRAPHAVDLRLAGQAPAAH